MSELTQTQLRATISGAIAQYRSREISLSSLISAIDPVVDDLEPEATWEAVSELYTELDAYYGLIATDTASHQPATLSPDQTSNVDRIVNEIDRLLAGAASDG